MEDSSSPHLPGAPCHALDFDADDRYLGPPLESLQSAVGANAFLSGGILGWTQWRIRTKKCPRRHARRT